MAARGNAANGAPADTPIIRVTGLRKSFGRQVVLDGIDLDLHRGQTLSVLGRSGTGKSVLLRLIIGLLAPDAGSIRIGERDMSELSPEDRNAVRKTIGFLFQQAALYDSLTVAENVAFPLRRHTTMDAGDRERRVRELLARVGMEGHADKLPGAISGGMQKRVGLARALALDPEIMLLDEPTAGLDPITATEIVELIEGLGRVRETSAIVVTHDLRSVEALADHVVLLNEGAVAAQGSLDALKQSADPFVAAFVRPSFERRHV